MAAHQVRDSRQPGHFWADNEIADKHLAQIGVYGFAVYMLLARFADATTGQCDPSVEGMAKRLGVSAPTVRKALDKLHHEGLISIRHRRKERDGKVLNQTSVYTLLAVEKGQNAKGGKPHLVPTEIDQGGQGDLPGVLNHVSTNKTHKNKTQLTREDASANATAPRAPRKKTDKQAPKETTPIGIIKALATACQIDRDLATKETHIILAEAAGRLYKAGKGKEQTDEQIAETIRYVGSYFMKNDWRGKKGEPPTPGQLLDIWKRAIDARQTAAPETKYYQSQAHKYLQGDELRAAFDEAARKRARIRSVGEA